MKEMSLKPVIEKLEKLFSAFNEKYYLGELKMPIITIAPDTKKGSYGWCTSWKAWGNTALKESFKIVNGSEELVEMINKDEGYYEINICAEHLARPLEEIAETLLHEMAHLYNVLSKIQDTSRGGTYHNKKYKETAEQHGLIVERDSKYGWCRTRLNDESKAFIAGIQDDRFKIYRKNTEKIFGAAETKKSSRKYVCPNCGCIIRATKEVDVICGICNVQFEEVK